MWRFKRYLKDWVLRRHDIAVLEKAPIVIDKEAEADLGDGGREESREGLISWKKLGSGGSQGSFSARQPRKILSLAGRRVLG